MIKQLLCLATLLLWLASCSGPQQLFESPNAGANNANLLKQYFQPKEPIIRPGDKMTISIWGHEELSVGSVNSSFSSNEATGKWLVVDNDGEVNLPQIGRVKVGGYDIKEINYILEDKYSKLLKDPIINMKVLNHYVTVLGEVNKPGRYQLDNEQVSLVEIIGEASGMSPYAKGHEVKVIRTVRSQPVELVVDMTDLMTFSQYNVKLQPDDVVYIGANQKKGADEKLRRATTVTSIFTGIAIVVSIFLR
ncbi:MAG: polysaccharide export protein [Saprospiraceae bacterium]|nr:polysaccharide export protein [Saprospiraceae bacterium]MCF8283235.1 polysaccharide export protein [Bacteroidales bacterium]MCF8314359.1 polysaccharide export protein [Saprospiraceae bacterium]MCF8443229.1 polysaccharide export protein [Saprospiraceae bacterium]